MRIFKSCFSNISNQKYLNINTGYRYVFDIQEGRIFNNSFQIRLDNVLKKLPVTVLKKGELDQEYKLVDMNNVSSKINFIYDYDIVDKIDSDKNLMKEGNIIIPKMSTWQGKFILNEENKELLCSTEFMEYNINERLYIPKYLYYLIRTNKFLTSLKNLETGIAQRRINDYSLSMLYIPLTSLDEQRNILKYVKPIENEIEKLYQKIKSTQEIIDETFSSLFNYNYVNKLAEEKREFVCQFSDFANDELKFATSLKTRHIFNEVMSNIKEIEWINLGKIAIIKGGKRLPKGESVTEEETGFKYVRVEDLNKDGTFNIEDVKYIKEETQQKIKKYTAQENDLLITIVGSIGKIGVVPEDLSGENISENFAKVSFKDPVHYNSKFINYYMLTRLCKTQLRELTTKSSQGKIGMFRVRKILVPKIAIEMQDSIAKNIESEIRKQIDSEDKIRELQSKISAIIIENLNKYN
ncbi:MAG: restriction endonuclease subunit S [Acholeplasmataceae bacterium]|jgi:type I restriction enzyme S subunit